MPEVLSEPGQARGLVEFTEIMLTLSLARVQEVCTCIYIHIRKMCICGCAVLLCLVCLFDLACFFLSSFSSLINNMYILGLVFGVFGGFITPAFSFILS